MRRPTKVTATSLVEEALKARDDFMDKAMLMSATGEDANHVSAACIHLRKHRAIDCIIDPDGRAWWYPLPSDDDNRQRKVVERAVEGKRRPRKARKVVTK